LDSSGVGPLASRAIAGSAPSATSGALTNTGSTIGAGAGGGGFFGEGFFGEGGGASLALGGLQTLGSIWSSFQQMKLAKKSLKFQKDAFRTNLANSTKVYNTALEDRIRARYATEGRSEQADAKIAENRL